MFKRQPKSRKYVCVIALLVLAVLSMTVLSNIFSSPKIYSRTIQTLDKQKGVATTLNIAVTAASTALSLLPNDTASPVASELADLSLPLFIIVCVLYMEKFLLTTFGWIAFTFLIPLACVFVGSYIIKRNEVLLVYAKKVLILALALVIIIPVSTTVTMHVQETFSESISLVFAEIDSFSKTANAAGEEESNAFVKFFSDLKDDATSLVETAKNMLGIFADAIAVLLITCCAIPILTAALFVWVIKLVVSVDIPVRKLVKIIPSTKENLRQITNKKVVNQ